jgi:hypothetical protein
MPLPHTCNKCDVFINDILEYPLPHDYPDRSLIKEGVRRRLIPMLAKSLKKLIADYPVIDMKRVWDAILFENRVCREKNNYRFIADSLISSLSDRHILWKKELDLLGVIAIENGLIKMKGLRYGRIMILVQEWISYCIYLLWTQMPSVHYNHNFPSEKEVPDMFIFKTRSKNFYASDLYD